MYCKYLSKSLRNDFKCKKYKRYINYNVDCKNCLDFILVKTKPIKKVSKNRIFVTDETYNKVYERDNGECQLCYNTNIELHHIIYKSEDKKLINEPNNCIMLCSKCHKLVHKNKHYWQPRLKKMIKEKINGE